ncbi:hypothetical protein F4820DRAFT_447637 [Hypoxylon rubiginosum]|uniref:Uncharacterized protein n=1 Tax=Hypoxylon rubiginosum TaxID=110542 RepID=A0ACB9Z352_9PEZI|nr:hypothetical protein F4820DRAFT_447637 [Hypoxylon rubiginosum]
MSSPIEEMGLPILCPKYQGSELIKQLVTTWPDDIVDTPASRLICFTAAIFRWMASILEEGSQAPKLGPSNALLAFSLAEFPVHTDQKTVEVFSNAILACSRLFHGVWPEDHRTNLFDMLENELIRKVFWSELYNLIYKIPVWADCHGTIDLLEWPVDKIAKAGLIYLDDPRELAASVQDKLGLFKHTEPDTYLFLSPTPPQFIRVHWDNKSDFSLPKGESAFKTLEAFELSAQTAHLEQGCLSFHTSTTGYRLICCVKIPRIGEEHYAPHFYACDGRYFIPPTREVQRDWSCNDPGSYYLIYHKSDTQRRVSLERAVPFPSIGEARRKDSLAVIAKPNPPSFIASPRTPFKFNRRATFNTPRTPQPRARASTPAGPSTDRVRSNTLPPRPSQVPTGPRQPHQKFDFSSVNAERPLHELVSAKRKGETVQIRQSKPSPPRKKRKSDHCPDASEKEPWKNWRK